jgi:ABC-type transport system substrate-binding protein
MRSRPIGTGPFKFVEFKPNEVIRVTKNAARRAWSDSRVGLSITGWNKR